MLRNGSRVWPNCPTRDLDAIDETLILAQQEVLRLGEQLGGVAGTTISGVLLPTRVGDDAICSDERCYIVNVGDSRTYHMRADGNGAWLADSLTCITRDHSERQNAIDSGQMLPDEASRCIPRNIITQCVGAPAGIQPDWYAARADGRFIICSDGLHAQIGREQLAEIAAAYADPQMAADHAGTRRAERRWPRQHHRHRGGYAFRYAVRRGLERQQDRR